MAWIESHQSLARHRKTLRAAGRLSVDRATLIGHLHFLWWWALDNVGADGRLGDMTAYEIAAAAEWPGDPEQFLAALIEAGFIDETPDGLVLHDWYDYAGKFIDRREAERERSRQRRAKKRAQESRPAGDHATTDGRPRDDQRSTVGTLPNLTVPNQTIEDHIVEPPGPTPKPTKPEPKFGPGDPPYELARQLRAAILARDPTTKVPDETPAALARWAKDADLLLRVDKRDPQEAARLIEWCQRDPFWSANILSMAKFRKQYDQLKRKAGLVPLQRASPRRARFGAAENSDPTYYDDWEVLINGRSGHDRRTVLDPGTGAPMGLRDGSGRNHRPAATGP